MKVSVSILKEKDNINNIIERLNSSSTDYIHLDILDNTFTNTEAFKLSDFINIKNEKKYDIHIMSTNLDYQINEAIKLKPEYITFHLEATNDYDKYISLIKENNIKVGLAINPETNYKNYIDILNKVDLILVMSVVPGKGGQPFIDSIVDKVMNIRKTFSTKIISIDGGINDETSDRVRKYVDILVSGYYVTRLENLDDGINRLKKENN